MRRRWLSLLLPVLVVFVVAAGSSGPALANAKYASMVVDLNSGKILRSRNADAKRHPASLTKVMTLYIVFEEMTAGRLKKSDRITFSKFAAGKPPSKLGLKPGQTITVDHAIQALVTKSANDVAAAIAEHISGSEAKFAKRMTATARRLGMPKTSFYNASGLPDSRQVTTARDMVTLGERIMGDHAKLYSYFSTKSFKFRGKTYRNHNSLLRGFKGTTGIKTGYIRASGFNLIAAVERNKKKVIAVVMGGKTGRRRDAHMRKIITEAFPKALAFKALPHPPPRSKPTHMLASVQTPVTAATSQIAAMSQVIATPAPAIAAASAQIVTPTRPTPTLVLPQTTGSDRQGVVLLTMASLPPRDRELPLAEPISRDVVQVPSAPRVASNSTRKQAGPRLVVPSTSTAAPIERLAAVHVQPQLRTSVADARPVARPTAHAPRTAEPALPPRAATAFSAPAIRSISMEDLIASATNPIGSVSGAVATTTQKAPAGRLDLPVSNQARRIASTGISTVEQGSTPQPFAPPPAAAVPDGYQIQVGAYYEPEPVEKMLVKAKKSARGLLEDAHAFTQTAQKNDSTIYRARFAGLAEGQAKRACKTLKRRKIACLVIAQ